jgi:hypothetical protein
MNQEQISKLELSIQNMKDKKMRLFFLVQDTKGNPKASVAYIYQFAYTLHKSGYNVVILHEKSDYLGVSSWMGAEYDNMTHQSIEGQNLQVSPEDFIVLPELYGFVMPQITKLPCGKIVLSQAYDHILETLQPGQSWSQFGFHKCITTSETQKDYILNLMRNTSIDIIPPTISDKFQKNSLPPKPTIAVHTRDQRDTLNIIKSFYLKFPQYRWVTFRDMRNMDTDEFAKVLRESFMSVWVDETSSYGTFPLESMKSGVPVLGLTPTIVPEWINEENGLWINNKNQIVDFIADFLQNWLEDNISEKLYEEMDKTVTKLPSQTDFENNVLDTFGDYISKRLDSFESQLNKLEVTE